MNINTRQYSLEDNDGHARMQLLGNNKKESLPWRFLQRSGIRTLNMNVVAFHPHDF